MKQSISVACIVIIAALSGGCATYESLRPKALAGIEAAEAKLPLIEDALEALKKAIVTVKKVLAAKESEAPAVEAPVAPAPVVE
jgi:hypothetical protein